MLRAIEAIEINERPVVLRVLFLAIRLLSVFVLLLVVSLLFLALFDDPDDLDNLVPSDHQELRRMVL